MLKFQVLLPLIALSSTDQDVGYLRRSLSDHMTTLIRSLSMSTCWHLLSLSLSAFIKAAAAQQEGPTRWTKSGVYSRICHMGVFKSLSYGSLRSIANLATIIPSVGSCQLAQPISPFEVDTHCQHQQNSSMLWINANLVCICFPGIHFPLSLVAIQIDTELVRSLHRNPDTDTSWRCIRRIFIMNTIISRNRFTVL